MTAIVLIVAAMWLLFSIAVNKHLYAIEKLPRLEEIVPRRTDEPDPRNAPTPAVTVVIAGRDEERRIEETVRRLLKQRSVELRLIVVDDRSTDRTPQILAGLAKEEPRVEVIRIDTLPDGWLGKCNALQQGASYATTEWLLFTDADIHMEPELIARAVAMAEHEQADHVTLFPNINCRATVVRAAVLAFGQFLALYAVPAEVNRDRGTKGVGVGAFNLLKTSVYRAIGAHERLRLEVVDDIKLGRILRQANYRTRVYDAADSLECEWAHTPREMIKVTEKNWFAGLEYNLPKAIFAIVFIFTLWSIALLGPLLSYPWGWLATAALATTMIAAIRQTLQFGWGIAPVLLTPLAFVLFPVCGLNSTWKTLRQGGVRWRDTLYPLDKLRHGVVR